jgi:hypothetical protein
VNGKWRADISAAFFLAQNGNATTYAAPESYLLALAGLVLSTYKAAWPNRAANPGARDLPERLGVIW